MLRSHRALLAGLVALLVQCYVLYTPGSPDPVVAIGGIDKVVHLLIFAIPAWLFVRAGVRWWLVLTLAVLQSLLSEYVQGRWLPHRGADLWDIAFDLLGAVLGVLVARRRPAAVRGRA